MLFATTFLLWYTVAMNILNMEYFLTVAHEQNITRAAQVLNVSQQALSNLIARMEDELNCKLFSRGKILELTDSGKAFYKSVEQILDIKRQTENTIDDINHNKCGELKIGISHTRGQAMLPILLPAFSKKYPLVDLKVVEGSTQHLEDYLERGQIDVLIGFAPFMVDCADYTPLSKEHLYLIIPNSLLSEHFPGKEEQMIDLYNKSLNLQIFENFPFVLLKKGDRIRTKVDKSFKDFKMSPNIILETENTQTAFSLSSLGMGITVCPELYLNNSYVVSGNKDSEMRKNVTTCLFSGENEWDTIAIGYNKYRYVSQIAKDFIKMSIEALK